MTGVAGGTSPLAVDRALKVLRLGRDPLLLARCGLLLRDTLTAAPDLRFDLGQETSQLLDLGLQPAAVRLHDLEPFGDARVTSVIRLKAVLCAIDRRPHRPQALHELNPTKVRSRVATMPARRAFDRRDQVHALEVAQRVRAQARLLRRRLDRQTATHHAELYKFERALSQPGYRGRNGVEPFPSNPGCQGHAPRSGRSVARADEARRQ